MKVTIEWKRKRSCVIHLDETKWMNSLDNLLEAGLLKGANTVWVWYPQTDSLWSYRIPE